MPVLPTLEFCEHHMSVEDVLYLPLCRESWHGIKLYNLPFLILKVWHLAINAGGGLEFIWGYL